MPSPQIVKHSSGVFGEPPVHSQPSSTIQLSFQPSPFMRLPSSQVVPLSIMRKPSPQTSSQVLNDDVEPPVHKKPASTLHQPLQPSLLSVFPSSHSSSPYIMESPQIGVQVSFLFRVPPEHSHPISTSQFSSQPSPGVRLPSSQSSMHGTLMPSPQVGWQISGAVPVY